MVRRSPSTDNRSGPTSGSGNTSRGSSDRGLSWRLDDHDLGRLLRTDADGPGAIDHHTVAGTCRDAVGGDLPDRRHDLAAPAAHAMNQRATDRHDAGEDPDVPARR